jgi:CHAT domain-containing protein
MKKLFILLCLNLLATYIYASCCSFELAYIPEVLNVPSEETLSACLKVNDCDSLFLFTGRMIRAHERRNLTALSNNFEHILSIIKKKDKSDTNSLKIVYLYATFLERAGESTVSSAYYEFVEKNSPKESALNILAEIGRVGIRNSLVELEQTKVLVIDKINHGILTTDEVLSILIRLNNYLGINEGYSLSQNSSILPLHLLNDLDPDLYYIYLNKVVSFLAHEEEDKRFNHFFSKAMAVYTALPKGKYYKYHLRLKSSVSTANGQYNDALKESEKLVKLSLDSSESMRYILNISPKYDIEKYRNIHAYATANLYQTRVKPGLDPVKKAFDLYEMVYKRKLENSLKSVNGLIADRLFHVQSYEINLLIVGCYLYQKTNDVSYLSRAISVLDGNIGAGNYYWANARSFARSNDSFLEDLSVQRVANNSLSSINSKTLLSSIFSQQETLKNQQEKILTNYPGFSSNLSQNGSINLNEVSEWCARDSSAILAFYMADGAQYRLLITPDTIDIIDLDAVRSKALSLTSQLQTISNPKAEKEANADASRELYRLLFSGVDSLLPPNVHIIATGELENVPFPALRREAEGEPARYLGTEVAISRQISINSMRVLRGQEMAPRYKHPLGLAPTFANESLPAAELRQAGFVLPPLFYNTKEVKRLEERGAGTFFYGKEATLSNYLDNVADHSIIHLATHAISSQVDGLRSRIYLAGGKEKPGELFTSNIGDQTLNADLVVLSACETGSGSRHATEGRISLTKAYLAAGARSVVSSNWAVDDFATAVLMETFYEHIQNGKPPHQALQLSRKAYLDKYPNAPPYKWAAFEAYGGMKPVAWDRSRSVWPAVGYGSLALVSLGLGAAYLRRRRKALLRA